MLAQPKTLMKKLNLGFDFDGVFTDCSKLKSYAARTLYNKEIPPEQCNWQHIVNGGILTAEQYRELQRQIYGERAFVSRTEAVPGAISYAQRFQQAGHNVKIVTARTDEWAYLAREWLLERGAHIPLTATRRRDKTEACKGLDLFVDDDLDKLLPLIRTVKHLYLFSWPCNQNTPLPREIQRVRSWYDIHTTIGVLSALGYSYPLI